MVVDILPAFLSTFTFTGESTWTKAVVVHQHRDCVQEGPELALLLQEALVLQCVQSDAPDVSSVCVARTIFFAVVSWAAAIKAKPPNRLNKRIRKTGSVVASWSADFEEEKKQRILTKLLTIIDYTSYPLHESVNILRCSFINRMIQTCCYKI